MILLVIDFLSVPVPIITHARSHFSAIFALLLQPCPNCIDSSIRYDEVAVIMTTRPILHDHYKERMDILIGKYPPQAGCLFGEEAGKNAQRKKSSCKSPGKLLDEIHRSGRAEHLISSLTTESGVYATAFRILNKDN